MMHPEDKPCLHNAIPLTKRILGIGPKRTFWRCIKCQMDFDEQPFDPWGELAKMRAEIEVNEHGAWIGCKSVYLIEEEP